MMISQISTLTLVSCLLISCAATPPGQENDSELRAKNLHVTKSVPAAIDTFRQSLRYCGPYTSTGLITALHHGVPVCETSRPDGTVLCDMYVQGNRNHPMGRVDFMPEEKGTVITFRLRHAFWNYDDIFNAWEKFIQGNPQEICGDNRINKN